MGGLRTLRRALLGVAVAAAGVVMAPPAVLPPADAAPLTFNYSGPVVPIPDGSAVYRPATASMTVSGLGNSIDDIDFRIGGSSCNTTEGSTTVGIDHPSVWDLWLRLTSPQGTRIDLMRDISQNGGTNLCQLFFDDEATRSIQTAAADDAPYIGSWIPKDSLSWFDGEDPNGTWTLTAIDDVTDLTGSIRAFSLRIDAHDVDPPAGEFRFRGPIVTIPDMFGNTDDPPTVAEAHVQVGGLEGDIRDVNFSIDGSHCTDDENAGTVGISHIRPSDLELFLISPEGTKVSLFWRVNASGRNFCDVLLDDEGTDGSIQGIGEMSQLWGKAVKPREALSAFDGEDPNGYWTFRVEAHGATFRENFIRAFTIHVDAPDTPDPSGLAWSPPSSIVYGTPLSATQLNATADVAGTFTYTPPLGTVLDAGARTLSVQFVPTDSSYATESTTVALTVIPAPPGLAWPNPAPITYGTPLSAVQLDATADVAGTFTYDPPAGSVLDVGIHSLAVRFVPTSPNYAIAATGAIIAVGSASSGLAWAPPASVVYGTALSAAQLNATAAVPGTFVYSPPLGTVLDAGTHTLSVQFTPTSSNHAAASTTVPLTVTPASAGLAWTPPPPVAFGTALSATQLNATASVDGTFTYTPPLGTVLPVGTHTLSVQFTPASTNYAAASTTVSLMVVPASTVLTMTQLPDGSGQLAARLTTTGGAPIAGQSITFWLAPARPADAPQALCSAITSASGEARCTITGVSRLTLSLPGSSTRNRFTATFAGTASYLPSTVTVGGPAPVPPKGKG